MNIKTTIFNSEHEFRECVIQNANRISHIIVFGDILDSTIFFYCFTKDCFFFATKEHLSNDFFIYRKIYEKLAEELALKPYYRHLCVTIR